MNALIERYYGIHTLFYRALKMDGQHCNVDCKSNWKADRTAKNDTFNAQYLG